MPAHHSLRRPAFVGFLTSATVISVLYAVRAVLPTAVVAALVLLVVASVALPTHRQGATLAEGKPGDGTILREEAGVTVRTPLVPLRVSQRSTPLPKVTMAEVATHDHTADLWVVINGIAYDVTDFSKTHPGGATTLLGVGGRDATDAFENYHSARTTELLLPSYAVGRVTDPPAVPPAVADFRELRQSLLARGLYATEWRFYLRLGTWLATLYCSALGALLLGQSMGVRMFGAMLMGAFWQQLAGLGHDLGHSGVSHRFQRDHALGSALAALMGISTTWWKRSHNTHHVVCNSIEHDPDIQTMPLIAVSSSIFLRPFYSSYYRKMYAMDEACRTMVSYQHLFLYPLMAVARFTLYKHSWRTIFFPRPHEPYSKHTPYRNLEAGALVAFATWVLWVSWCMPSWVESVLWVLLSHAVAGILHVQIIISHWAMATYEGRPQNNPEDEWYRTQLATTMDVLTPTWLDWIHIGLQFQIEHHLYPRVPRTSLRVVREGVRAICTKHAIHYHEPTFWRANVETVKALRQAAHDARSAVKGNDGFYRAAAATLFDSAIVG